MRSHGRPGPLFTAWAQGVLHDASVNHFHLCTDYCVRGDYMTVDTNDVTNSVSVSVSHRVHRVANAAFWRIHSVMRINSVLAGEGGGCTPTPSHYIYPHQ